MNDPTSPPAGPRPSGAGALATAAGGRTTPGRSGGAGRADSADRDLLDRLSQRLTMAGLRLLSLRQRLDRPEDQIMLAQAGEDLDEAIAEIRRLALASRVAQEGGGSAER